MKKIIVLLLTGLLIIISGCSTLFGPTEEELQQAKQQQEIKKNELIMDKVGCSRFLYLLNSKTKKQQTDFEKLNHIFKVNYSYRIMYPLRPIDRADYTNITFNKGDLLLIENGAIKVFQNIPNVGILIYLEGAYNTKFSFMIKGYHDVDGATIDKTLLLVNNGIFSYESNFGTKTVYSFVIAKDKNNFLSNYIERMELAYQSNISKEYCKSILKNKG